MIEQSKQEPKTWSIMATGDDNSQRRSEVYKQIDELKRLASKDPAQIQRIFSSALQEIKACLEELSFADGKKNQPEESVSVKEEHLRALMDHNPSLIFLKDESGRYVYLNSAYERNFVRSKDWYGKTDFDIWPKESAELFRENDVSVLKSGHIQQFLEDSTDLDGTRHCWLCYKFPFTDSYGAKYVGGIGIDATDRVQAEEALHASEERLRAFIDHLPIAVQGYGADGIVTYWNRASERLYGYTAEEAIGRNLGDLIIPLAVQPHFSNALKEASKLIITGEFLPAGDLELQRKDGSLAPIYSTHTAVCSPGQPPTLFCSDLDLTPRKQAEEALRQSEELFRAFFNISAVGTAQIGLDERFTEVNDRLCQITGYSRQEMLGMTPTDLTHPDDRQREKEKLSAYLQGLMGDYQSEKRYIHKGGQVVLVQVTASLIRDAQGKPQCSMAVIQDITERKKAEEALRESENLYRTLFEHTDDREEQGANSGLQAGVSPYRLLSAHAV